MELINCEGYPDDLLVSGVYFKPEKHVCKHYLIAFIKCENDGNGKVKIYETEIPQDSGEIRKIKNGTECKAYVDDNEFVFEIDLWGKYFFPKFNNEMQMYYDDKKYFGADYDTDEIFAIAECFNFALAWGLQMAKIKPY